MIHHYTSINNLALILKTGKIRFTRMDLVDDLKESDGLQSFIEKLAFILCWTENLSENSVMENVYPEFSRCKADTAEKPFATFKYKAGTYKNVTLNRILAFLYRSTKSSMIIILSTPIDLFRH